MKFIEYDIFIITIETNQSSNPTEYKHKKSFRYFLSTKREIESIDQLQKKPKEVVSF